MNVICQTRDAFTSQQFTSLYKKYALHIPTRSDAIRVTCLTDLRTCEQVGFLCDAHQTVVMGHLCSKLDLHKTILVPINEE